VDAAASVAQSVSTQPTLTNEASLSPAPDSLQAAGSPPAAAQTAVEQNASVEPPVEKAKKRVLFVCIGNSCRSQMAEGFARTYGSDVLIASSAGLSPATLVAPMTKQMLAERNINIDEQFPKGMDVFLREPIDVVVNMSGMDLRNNVIPGGRLPLSSAKLVDWPVPDPIGQKESVYQSVAAQIETLVMRLILELRAAS